MTLTLVRLEFTQMHFISFALQLRGAVLAEITLAVKLLVKCQQFSTGMATAVSTHIRYYLGHDFEWEHIGGVACLEHTMLLPLEPLQELLDFFWTQLGLKMELLEPFIRAQEVLRLSVSGTMAKLEQRHCFLLNICLSELTCAAGVVHPSQAVMLQACGVLPSALEVHSDSSVQYSLHHLQHLGKCHAPLRTIAQAMQENGLQRSAQEVRNSRLHCLQQ